MFRTWGIQKSMFAFAQTPAWPPYWTFKMAAINGIIFAILASRQPRNFIKHANPMFSGSRNTIETQRIVYSKLLLRPLEQGQGNSGLLC